MSADSKQFIGPFVRNARFPDLETSIKVADKALDLYTQIKSRYNVAPNGAACVGLAGIALGVMNDNIMQNIIKSSGQNMKNLIKSINEVRTLLNVPLNLSFTSIAEGCNIPTRYANTANDIHKELLEKDPNDIGLKRPAVYAGILLCIAVARGLKKDQVLQNLAKTTYSDPAEVLAIEKMVREQLGGKYGLKPDNNKPLPPEGRREVSNEIKKASSEIMAKMNEEKGKKKKQTTLQF